MAVWKREISESCGQSESPASNRPNRIRTAIASGISRGREIAAALQDRRLATTH